MRMHVQRPDRDDIDDFPFSDGDLMNHLRITDQSEIEAVRSCGRAAALEIEEFAQVALAIQTIRVLIFDPSTAALDFLRLPISPGRPDTTPTVTIDGEPFTAFEYLPGSRPMIRWLAPFYELVPQRISIEYSAGFATYGDLTVPDDLTRAVYDQAAALYDGRSPMNDRTLTTSPHMARIGARYRGVRA